MHFFFFFFKQKNRGKESTYQSNNFQISNQIRTQKKKKKHTLYTEFTYNSHNRELNQNPETKTYLYDKNKTINTTKRQLFFRFLRIEEEKRRTL